MSTELKTVLKDVEAALKRSLKHGEVLQHVTLGKVTYSESCAELEKRVGFDETSIHVEHEGECKEVSLGMIRRTLPDGRVIRMQADTDKLALAMAGAEEFLGFTENVKSATPIVKELLEAAPNLYS